MVYRIYVEKKPGFDVEATGLKNELTSLLGIKELSGLRLLNRYDVEGIDEELFNQCADTVFSEPPVDNTYAELPAAEGVSFACLLYTSQQVRHRHGLLRPAAVPSLRKKERTLSVA